jgi:diguanylate cyclase (GGDEF)-like protein/PAS domain S-box-containing protein
MSAEAGPTEVTDPRTEELGAAGDKMPFLRLNPIVLGYLIGPLAFLLILALEHFGVIAKYSPWLWFGLFLTIALLNVVADKAFDRRPNASRRQIRLALHAATATAVIYMTGWGPILIPAYSIGALVTISREGSRSWKSTFSWSVLGVTIGQTFIAVGWVSCFLSLRDAQAIAIMNVFLLYFILHMASGTVARREVAEESARASEQSLRRSEERFRALVQNSTDAILVVDVNRAISYASPSVSDLLGMSFEELLGADPLGYIHSREVHEVQAQIHEDLLNSSVSQPIEVKMQSTSGQMRDVEAVVTNLLDDPAVEGFVINMRDITDRKVTERLLIRQAHQDGLTGLPNRVSILKQADVMLERCRVGGKHLAVFFIDLDYFKDINDTLGHETGDEVLRVVAHRLASRLRPGETLGRIGGDEFVVCVEAPDSEEIVGSIAKRLQSALEKPIAAVGQGGPLLELTISIGAAHGLPESASELLREADMALYQAKLAGRDAWVTFEPDMRSSALRRLQLQSELATALDQCQFSLLYQPIIDIDDGQMPKVEALVRWEHPVRGTVAPDEFIPALEQSGHIVQLGAWVMDEACRQATQWWSRGHLVTIGINASARELQGQDFVPGVLSALKRHRLAPEALTIEITEHGLLHATEMAGRNLALLKRHGIRVAIDDFGTGYSSLAYLLQFDVDALKIDKSFVAAMEHSEHAMAVVRAILQLGRTLGLEVIAEGVEDSEQLALLRAEGCRFGQGHLFSRPVPASIVGDRLAGRWHGSETSPERAEELSFPGLWSEDPQTTVSILESERQKAIDTSG